MKKLVVAGVLLLVPQVASAQSMNAEVFHKRAEALQQKGMMALFSVGEIKALTNEGQAAGLNAKKQRDAALAAGQKPRFCPPKGAVTLGSDEFMKRLSAIPAADRSRIDMTEATTRILTAKFPCPA